MRSDSTRWRRGAVAISIALLTLTGALTVEAASDASRYPGPISAGAGGRAWVAESGPQGVIEFDPLTGAILRVVSGPQYRFDDPVAIAVVDGDVWVASVGFTGEHGYASAARLTEFAAASGDLVRVVDLKKRGVQGLSELWASGSTLWVSASVGAAIVELDTRTGRILHSYINGHLGGNSQPSGVVVSQGRVIYVDEGSLRIVVRDIATGRITRTFSPSILWYAPGTTSKVPFSLGPRLLAVTPQDIWAVCGAGRHLPAGSVIEINRRSGRVVRTIDAVSNDLYDPIQVVSHAGRLCIIDGPVGYKNQTLGAALTVIDEETGQTLYVVHFLRLDGKFADPSGLAFANGRILVSDPGAQRIVVLNPMTGQVLRVIR